MKLNRLIPIVLFLALLLALSRNIVTPAQATTPTLILTAPGGTIPAAGTIAVSIAITGAAGVGAFEFDLLSDSQYVQVISVTQTTFLGQVTGCNPNSTRCVVALGPLAQPNAATSIGAYTYGTGGGANGDGTLAVIHLRPTGVQGTTNLQLANALVTNTAGTPTTPTVQGTTLTLGPPTRSLYLPLILR